MAFYIVWKGLYYSEEQQKKIFYSMGAIVLVFGLLVSCLFVKNKKVKRNYVKDDKNKVKRIKVSTSIDEIPEDSGEYEIDNPLPEAYEFIKGYGLTLKGKTKLLFKQTWNALTSGDVMLYFILYGVFVNAMLAFKATSIIYLWTTKWIVKTEEDKVYDHDMTGAESWDRYLDFMLVNFIASSLIIPLFGFLSDKIDLGSQMIFAFGVRAVACLAMFVLDTSEGNIVLFTFVMITLNSNLQATVIDSLWAKRLPGDVRGVMQGGKTFVSNLGHITFVVISLLSAEYFDDVMRSIIFCGLFDGSMCFLAIVGYVTY